MARAEGYVRFYRSVLDNPVFKDHGEAMAFIYLVGLAAWSPTRITYKGQSIVLQRGQLAISVRDLAAQLGRDRGWAQRFLKRLEKRDMTVTAPATGRVTGVSVITICNYEKYQGQIEPTVTASATAVNRERDTEQRKKERKKETKGSVLRLPLETTGKDNIGKFCLPDWVPRQAWMEWLEMRRSIKKPASIGAQRIAVNKLAECMARGHDPQKVLERSTLNCWQSLYPDDKDGTTFSVVRRASWDGQL